jgi:hypothetical protein
VVRFEISDGYIYLKHTPELLALEANIIQVLHNQFHASVPTVIAHNADLHCFLMKDAGKPFRATLKKKFDTPLLCKAVEQFTSLQLTVADKANTLIDIGVPDWRLDKLPGLFKQLLLQKDISIRDELSETDIIKVEKLLPTASDLREKLSDYPVKQTLVQCDFHDNNILVDEITQKITFIDLGEIVISHPFFSLVGYLWQTKKHHGLTDKNDAHLKLKEACFKNYMAIENKAHLSDAFETTRILWFVY